MPVSNPSVPYRPRHSADTIVGDGESWTPSDSTPLDQVSAGIYVNAPGGNVAVQFVSGRQFLFKSYVGWLPVGVKYILATGTTATDIGVFF